MRRARVDNSAAAALRAMACLLMAACAPVWGAVISVGPGMALADAVAAAAPGDTVRVLGGRHPGHLLINKPLTLEGVGKPVISAGGSGDAVRITASGVTLTGFVVRDSGADLTAQNAGIYVAPGAHRVTVADCDIIYNLFGIWLERSDDARLLRNLVVGRPDLQSAARGNGIQVYNTRGVQVIGNRISHARDGIYVDVSRDALFRGNEIHHVRYGTHYMNTNHSTWEGNKVHDNRGGLALMEVRNLVVRRNQAWRNADHGIMLRTIQDSVIEDNVVAGNGRGLFIYDAEYNVVRRNLVVGNQTGVHLSAGSSNNAVDGNDFIGNQEQVRFVAARDTEWGRSAGNYWSNYSGWDQDGDGVGDFPYEANDLVDRLAWQYPLMQLLSASPALRTLRYAARQFPVLRAPSVVDRRPRMQPQHPDWRDWNAKFSR
ncbi:nitrous oxide reductase family maturation protein NosD [Pseudoduganella aquatica]|nr:nitrous oxide reductase family maturation protein NosD [Pseudoduganella aquatica]